MDKHKKASFIILLLLIWNIFITPILYKVIIYIAPVKLTVSLSINPSYLLIYNQLITFLPFIILYFIIEKKNIKEILILRKISFKNIIIIIFISIFMQPLLMFINKLTLFFTNNVVNDLINSSLRYPIWQIILASVIIPPFLEEIFFRGIIIKQYEKYSFWYGIIFSSIFFGIVHLNLNQFFYTIILGLITAFLVKISGSIWASILCHFIFNGTQIILGYSLTKYSSNHITTNSPFSMLIFYSILIISSIFFVLSIYLFIKMNKEKVCKIKNNKYFKPKINYRIFNVYFIIDILLLFYAVFK